MNDASEKVVMRIQVTPGVVMGGGQTQVRRDLGSRDRRRRVPFGRFSKCECGRFLDERIRTFPQGSECFTAKPGVFDVVSLPPIADARPTKRHAGGRFCDRRARIVSSNPRDRTKSR